MKTKILFVDAHDAKKRVESVYPPLNLAYLASYLKKNLGCKDLSLKIITERYEKEILSFSPDMIGVSCVTQNYGLAIEIASFAKKRGIPVIIGGVHISNLPESLNRNFDVGVIGEGERTLSDLVRLFEKKRSFPENELSKIKGLVFFNKKGKIIFTGEQELMKDVDAIPFPCRSLLDIDKETIFMMSSRGCPYKCYFCSSSSFWGKARFHSADYVVDEIRQVMNDYSPKKIIFFDDLFIADLGRLRKIVSKIEKSGINNKVTFHVSARANLVNDEVISLLKRMNVSAVNIGFESGSDETLRYLKGSAISVKDNINAISLLKKSGIFIAGSFVMGCPIDSKKTIMDTYRFIKKHKINDFAVYVLTPFPKTKAWDYALSKGLVSNDMDFSRLSIDYEGDYRDKITICPNMSKNEIYSVYRKFLRLHTFRRVMSAVDMAFKRPKDLMKAVNRRLRFRDIGGYN